MKKLGGSTDRNTGQCDRGTKLKMEEMVSTHNTTTLFAVKSDESQHPNPTCSPHSEQKVNNQKQNSILNDNHKNHSL